MGEGGRSDRLRGYRFAAVSQAEYRIAYTVRRSDRARHARIVVDGNKLATAADLKPGAHVAVFLTKEGDKAVGITATTKAAGDKKPDKPVKP